MYLERKWPANSAEGRIELWHGSLWTGSQADGRISSDHFGGSPREVMWGSVPQVNNRIAARTEVRTDEYKRLYVLSPLLTVAR
ncbi:MAG: hypothetical protein F4X66_17440 [Chloroflexi bacterium]|nr:hypothetical protein [Chloroflexota bacterium]MYE38917.1 hypothetical protein [Chloroflexota bacterium]